MLKKESLRDTSWSEDTSGHCDSLSMDNTRSIYAIRLHYRWHMALCHWAKARSHETKTRKWLLPWCTCTAHKPAESKASLWTQHQNIKSAKKWDHKVRTWRKRWSKWIQCSLLAPETTASSQYAGKRSNQRREKINRRQRCHMSNKAKPLQYFNLLFKAPVFNSCMLSVWEGEKTRSQLRGFDDNREPSHYLHTTPLM